MPRNGHFILPVRPDGVPCSFSIYPPTEASEFPLHLPSFHPPSVHLTGYKNYLTEDSEKEKRGSSRWKARSCSPTSVNARPHEQLFLSPETEAGIPQGADVSAAIRKRSGKTPPQAPAVVLRLDAVKFELAPAFVQPPGASAPVSAEGGRKPVESTDGRELCYRNRV